MRVAESEKALHDYLTARGFDSREADVPSTLVAMIDWYAARRATDAVPVDEDGDMLLFQWGTYDWGEGRWFEVNLTRQLMLASEVDDDAIMQLSLTFRYPPDDVNATLGSGQHWCSDPGEVPSFRDLVEQHAVTAYAATRRPDGRSLHLENAG